MTRTEHLEQVERWAHFVKNNPDKWKNIHTEFINAQFEKHRRFIKNLLRQKDGFEKIIELYNIKNIEDYRRILKLKN